MSNQASGSACLSARLDDTRLEQKEKDELAQKFIDAAKKVNACKEAMEG